MDDEKIRAAVKFMAVQDSKFRHGAKDILETNIFVRVKCIDHRGDVREICYNIDDLLRDYDDVTRKDCDWD